ncbi:MAG: hypothetical protein H6623_01465 [Bdellovibrionaceae bacterium]|nr:hypothetical protein [Pseudobdellovibrionaceae bacterium]
MSAKADSNLKRRQHVLLMWFGFSIVLNIFLQFDFAEHFFNSVFATRSQIKQIVHICSTHVQFAAKSSSSQTEIRSFTAVSSSAPTGSFSYGAIAQYVFGKNIKLNASFYWAESNHRQSLNIYQISGLSPPFA